ncbi:MAG: stealth family protein, partial [Roseburia sp.]|nr:stealth family protein [Roseburia sp.]
MKQMNEKNDIDFVLTWVDGSDPIWKKEKEERMRRSGFHTTVDDREERYRDWDNLKYWFRGVEKCAPWVRKIHFVTWGHVPKWLNRDHPKLNIVNHKDFIPAEFLPTFNSHTIEWNLHRIKDLNEKFVYFNDDLFLVRNIGQNEFFKGDLPVDMLALQPDVANIDNEVMPYIYLNNAMLLAKYFDKHSNMRKQPGAYFHIGYPLMYWGYNLIEMAFSRFTGFYTVHGPSPLCKSTYQELWKK